MPSGLIQTEALDRRTVETLFVQDPGDHKVSNRVELSIWSALLVVLPVFLQAPWVRLHPFSASLFSVVLVSTAIPLGWSTGLRRRRAGALLLGFSGSWLAGSLFWGWLRAHPAWHLPVEAFALPLALGGLGTRWRLGCSFYLASLVGTAMTDLAMALTGVMRFWPQVVEAPLSEAGLLLNSAAQSLRAPSAMIVILGMAVAILTTATLMRANGSRQGPHAESLTVAASVLITTVMVDGLFLLLALVHPDLSGLI